MVIPTVDYLKKKMEELKLDTEDLAKVLVVSERTIYRMISKESSTRRDRACITFVLEGIEADRRIKNHG